MSEYQPTPEQEQKWREEFVSCKDEFISAHPDWKEYEMTKYEQFYPKPRTGKECTKSECTRHADYLRWQCGTNNLNFCMECKHAHVSQFKRKDAL